MKRALDPVTHSLAMAAAILLGLAVVWTEASAAPMAVAHRAVYDLSLVKSADSGQITQAGGKLEFEWADACANWTISQRALVNLVSAEGQVIEFGWSLNALEAKDGSQYRFFIRRLNPGQPVDEVRGKARIAKDGTGVADFELPEESRLDLPKGTLFPTAHSLMLLDFAERGEPHLGRVVFDGSGDEGIFFVNAAVTEQVPADIELPFDSPLLQGQASWRIDLAYFALDEKIAEPQHEQAMRLYANGVVDDLILDYGDFALRASLQSLEPLTGGC
jgi:hypothetical protein